MLLATFGLFLFILVLIFVKPSNELKLKSFSTPLFWQTAFSIVALATFLIIYTFEAYCVNESYNKHRLILAQHSYQLDEEQAYITAKIHELSMSTINRETNNNRRKLSDFHESPEITYLNQELMTLKRISTTLSSISHLLGVQSQVNPTEVFGLKAELSLTFGLISALLSLFLLLISVYLSLKDSVKTVLA